MTPNRIKRAVGIVAASALTIAGLSAVAIAPAGAATRSTVILHSAGEMTSFNPSAGSNTTYNNVVSYLTSSGFYYIDKDTKVIRNTQTGTFKVVKNTATDFRIEYTVRKGQKWSDGTPIDAVDLLLSHVTASSAYSKAAGLGDPTDEKVAAAFDSLGYGGAYDKNVVGNPVLSNGNMTLTVRFGKPLPDWELLAPGPSAVHALQLMADGKKKLGTVAESVAAKAKFLKAFNSKDTANLKKMGKVWTDDYNIKTVNSSTNPLLFVSNGGFIVKSAVADQSMTLVRNPNYTSGPAMAKTNPVNTILIKTIKSSVEAAAALRNGDIDIFYDTNPSATSKATLDKVRGVTVIAGVAASYSFLNLRVDNAFGENNKYTGPFAGNTEKAKDLRQAFLLALPRDEMVTLKVKPLNPTASTMDTLFAFPGTASYTTITKGSGSNALAAGSQESRTAKALELVKKHYPTASATNSVVDVKLLFADTPLRVDLNKLINAEAKKAGFKVSTTPHPDIFGNERPRWNPEYDAHMFGGSLTAITQGLATDTYKTTGSGNYYGWSDAKMDALMNSLQSDYLTGAQVLAKRAEAAKIIYDNAWNTPLYQNVVLTAYRVSIVNIKPSPLSPNIVWNYWEWHF